MRPFRVRLVPTLSQQLVRYANAVVVATKDNLETRLGSVAAFRTARAVAAWRCRGDFIVLAFSVNKVTWRMDWLALQRYCVSSQVLQQGLSGPQYGIRLGRRDIPSLRWEVIEIQPTLKADGP